MSKKIAIVERPIGKKGFGFLRLSDGRKVFVHISALKSSGFTADAAKQDAVLDIEYGKNEKGLYVKEIFEINGIPASGNEKKSEKIERVPTPVDHFRDLFLYREERKGSVLFVIHRGGHRGEELDSGPVLAIMRNHLHYRDYDKQAA